MEEFAPVNQMTETYKPTTEKCTALVLAAGSGKRMGGDVAKQYLELCGMPLICHALSVFEKSPLIDEIVLAVPKEDENFVREEIVVRYGFTKVKHIVPGGRERYDSVQNGLEVIEDGYVFIHDGARPFVTLDMLERIYEGVKKYGAVSAAVPVKDTIRLADEEGFSVETLKRECLYSVQTPQAFSVFLIKEAYRVMRKNQAAKGADALPVTDDVMVAELLPGVKAKMIPGSYRNIKITTSEDLEVAKVLI